MVAKLTTSEDNNISNTVFVNYTQPFARKVDSSALEISPPHTGTRWRVISQDHFNIIEAADAYLEENRTY